MSLAPEHFFSEQQSAFTICITLSPYYVYTSIAKHCMFSAKLISIIICDFQCQVQLKHSFRVMISPIRSNKDGELICA